MHAFTSRSRKNEKNNTVMFCIVLGFQPKAERLFSPVPGWRRWRELICDFRSCYSPVCRWNGDVSPVFLARRHTAVSWLSVHAIDTSYLRNKTKCCRPVWGPELIWNFARALKVFAAHFHPQLMVLDQVIRISSIPSAHLLIQCFFFIFSTFHTADR